MFFSSHPNSSTPRLPFYATILCLACVLILVVNGASQLHNLESLKAANTAQAQTTRVADRLQYLNVVVMDADSSLRGYFLSGQEAYLGPYRAAPLEINQQFKDLDALLAQSPAQRTNLQQLRGLVQRKMAQLTQAEEAYRMGGLREIVRMAETEDMKAVMDEIRLLVVIMVKEQQESVIQRSNTFYAEYLNAVILGIGINLCAIMVLALFYRLVRDSYMTRVQTERALQHANENLETTVAARTEQLSVLSRHLIRVSEVEKAKLARELHDEMGANLTSIGMNVASVSEQLKHSHPEQAAVLERARATLVDTVELKRRIIEDLRPSLLDHLGLAAALESYGNEFASVSGVNCEVLIEGAVDEAAPMPSIAVFRIVQESLNNVAKYAKARNVVIHLMREEDGLALEIADDGIGIAEEDAAKPRSHGLLGMRERALLLGGTLQIRRGRSGAGTCIEAYIPIGAGDKELSVPRPAAGGHIPSSPLYSTHPHTLPDLDDQLR
jgi:signal transduction histidine kinase